METERSQPMDLRSSAWVSLVRVGDTHHMDLIYTRQKKATSIQGLSPTFHILHF